jgi:hypothetical protein
MKLSKTIGFSVGILLADLWAVALGRAASFVRWAQDYCSADGSINASNDLHYSVWLLGCYVVSLMTAFAFSWVVARLPRLLLLLPGAFAAYAADEVIWLRPETPIHLFPTMVIRRPIILTGLALAIAAWFSCLPGLRRNEWKAERDPIRSQLPKRGVLWLTGLPMKIKTNSTKSKHVSASPQPCNQPRTGADAPSADAAYSVQYWMGLDLVS